MCVCDRHITNKHITHTPQPPATWPKSSGTFTVIILSFSLSDGAPSEQGTRHSSSDQQGSTVTTCCSTQCSLSTHVYSDNTSWMALPLCHFVDICCGYVTYPTIYAREQCYNFNFGYSQSAIHMVVLKHGTDSCPNRNIT